MRAGPFHSALGRDADPFDGGRESSPQHPARPGAHRAHAVAGHKSYGVAGHKPYGVAEPTFLLAVELTAGIRLAGAEPIAFALALTRRSNFSAAHSQANSALELPHTAWVASYSLNQRAIAHTRRLIDARQYVLDSDWGDVQPKAADENTFLEGHSWDDYAEWHLGLNDEATDETKSRYAFVYGDFRRVHRTGLIACQYRAAEWRHKEIELAAHELLQRLDKMSA